MNLNDLPIIKLPYENEVKQLEADIYKELIKKNIYYEYSNPKH